MIERNIKQKGGYMRPFNPGNVLIAFFLIFSMNLTCIASAEVLKQPNPGSKLANGLINVFTGWTEIPRHLDDSMREKKLGAVVEDGLIQGTACAVFRTAAGLIDAATFLIPPYDKALMEPLYQN